MDRGSVRPIDYGERVDYRPPPEWYRRVQWIAHLLTRLRLSPRAVVTLEVRGRKTGKVRRTSVIRAAHEGAHYLVALAGESNWVSNVRAAGNEAVIERGRQREVVILIEVPPRERAPIIESYLLRGGRQRGSRAVTDEARRYFGIRGAVSQSAIAEVVAFYPVFRIDRRGDSMGDGELVHIDVERDEPIPAYVARPEGEGAWPGVIVVHDALGMTPDLRRQTDWLASAGFLAVAPDLYRGGHRIRCMFRSMRDLARRSGETFDLVEAVRQWALGRADCTGRVGVIGFCLGGGYALLLAGSGDFQAASVNYGDVPKDAKTALAASCPIVASYGGRDRSLRTAPARLDEVLQRAGVAHDVKVYPEAGHGFLNDHDRSETPMWALVAGAFAHTGYHDSSARDARERITAFFDAHLRRGPDTDFAAH
jgi:carboxymethylenebutenolidase